MSNLYSNRFETLPIMVSHGVATPNSPERVMHSETLMQGRKVMTIVHNGRVYRLQTTKQGKLILTK